MIATVDGIPVHYAQHGGGTPVLALHGVGVDHREIMGALGPEMAAEYRNYLVVQTPATLRRFQETVAPGVALVDRAALERIFRRWDLRPAPEQGPSYPNPTLILAGRRDATVGYAGLWRLLEHYPRATFAVLDRAGHGLLHEQVGLVGALLAEWLERVGPPLRGPPEPA